MIYEDYTASPKLRIVLILLNVLSFEFFKNAVVLKCDKKIFTVNCDSTRLKSKLVDVHVVFGYYIVVKKKIIWPIC